MGDSDLVFTSESSFSNSKLVKKPLLNSALRKFKRNRWRILRRRRSKLNYLSRRRESRERRKSKDLCDTVSVFGITDMEMDIAQPHPSYIQPLEEVVTWQNQHQVAYWKSRATALEYENRMLHKLVESIYKHQIRDYVNYMEEHNESAEDQDNDRHETRRETRKSSKKQESRKAPKKDEICEPPSGHVREEQQERMASLYGDMAAKICGMETATQLNYDLYVERHDPSYWPNIPINLQF